MLLEVQAHYLDLIVQAVEATDHACLLVKHDEKSGRIYVTPSATCTKSVACLAFAFTPEGVNLGLQFRDDRPPVMFSADYADGIDGFFEKLTRSIYANRLEDKRAA